MYVGPTIRAYISDRRIKTAMTLFGIPTVAWIVVVLCVFVPIAWIVSRVRASRSWDFRDRSIQYLREKDFDRKQPNAPVPVQLDHEVVDR